MLPCSRRTARAAALALLALALPGCLGDPLVGTWRSGPNDIAPGVTLTIDQTFSADHTGTLVQRFAYAADNAMYPGCTETFRTAPFTWSDAHTETSMTFTVDAENATTTDERTGCANASDDMPEQPIPPGLMAMGLTTSTYTFNDDHTTLDVMTSVGDSGTVMNTTFTRQH
jgi:hypothetical protein